MSATIASEPPDSAPETGAPRLSVVMPAYNEGANIAAAIADVVAHVFAVAPAAELIVVDDGSRDDTRAIVEARARSDPRVRVIAQPNAGHGPALARGLRAARGEYCLLLDSDRQIPLDDFALTWRLVVDHDAVLGVRRDRADPRHRLILSAVLRAALAAGLDVRSTDPNAPYKLLRRDTLRAAMVAMPERPRIPSILLTVYLARRGLRTVEQPVAHRARAAGEPSLKLVRLARLCADAAGELLRFHRALDRCP